LPSRRHVVIIIEGSVIAQPPIDEAVMV